jgi:UDP-N-acetylglucosamine:LPS N-acetylglucosamine transferase
VETILNLLTREGAFYMAFQPSLSAEQYAELIEAVKKASTRQEMQKVVAAFAKRHKLAVSLDPAKGPT